jgi:regulator of sigma E protease
MMAVIIFIVILGLLIFVHEIGHFFVARKNGVKAEEFGFGFPPRIFGFIKDEETGKYKIIKGNASVESENTVYSINWIPLGGFVRIKGENGGEKKETDSFSGKSAWVRIKILAAGVIMNFVLAWVLISAALAIGSPEVMDVEKAAPGSKIQISEITPNSPAESAGIKIGDEITAVRNIETSRETRPESVKDLQDFITSEKGKQIILEIKRGAEQESIRVVPRVNPPEGEGALGVGLVATSIVRYSWYQAIWKGLLSTLELIGAIATALVGIVYNLILGKGVGADVAGPVGIAVLTKQVAGLGLVYVMQFAAILSINLGIINLLPIPGLDGGRIFFIIIEKIKGSPVSQKVEQAFHTVGFILLIMLLVVITFRDVGKFLN